MRLLATLVVFLAAAIYLHLGGVQTADTKDDKKNIFFYNNEANPNIEAYVKILEELRNRLASGTDVYGIAVTRDPDVPIPIEERFVQVQLENGSGNVITVIIDTVNVYVVGYLVGPVVLPTLLYLDLDNADQEALFQAFPSPQYNRLRLGFAGNYDSLPNRETQLLGHEALNNAIDNLYYRQSQRGAMVVIIQMVSEAVRIRYIEHLIRRSMLANHGSGENFIPDPRAISMENEWGRLSRQIQWSTKSNGVFLSSITLRNVLNEVVKIRNLADVMCKAALGLMLYQKCNPRPIIIRMPVPVPVAVGADEPCPEDEPTTNIIGRDGQCMDVEDDDYTNGNPIILWTCGNAKRNQLWTIKSDDHTIRSNGKCMATKRPAAPGNYIMIYDCHTAVHEDTEWVLYNARTTFAVEAQTSTPGTVLRLAEPNNSSRQAWRAGNYTEPTVNYISGLGEMCLQANGANARVWLANCVIGNEPSTQQWAFYGDGTIRLYSDRTLCVTSDGHQSLDSIILLNCQGWGNQRWAFMADGTILNPNARLVMDVRNNDVSLQEIILYQPNGNPNQKWLAF